MSWIRRVIRRAYGLPAVSPEESLTLRSLGATSRKVRSPIVDESGRFQELEWNFGVFAIVGQEDAAPVVVTYLPYWEMMLGELSELRTKTMLHRMCEVGEA